MKRKSIRTTRKEIVDYWFAILDESEFSVDHAEADVRCWRCGYQSILHLCHIIPHSLGGNDSPDNLVLLCNRCHREAPNINDSEFFWDWLQVQKAALYDTYWTKRGMLEYQDIYGEDVVELFLRLKINIIDFQHFLKKKEHMVAIHFGEGRLNPSTIAGLFRLFVKEVTEMKMS